MNNIHLIILPGWGGNKQTWHEFVEIAKPYFASVTVIELPCFGDEPCPAEVWGVEEYSVFVNDKIKNIKSKITDPNAKVIVMGHSFGGQVLAHVVGNNPDICDRVIFAASSIVREDFWFKRSALGFAAKVGKSIFFIPGIRQFEQVAKKVLYKVADSPDYQKTSGVQREIYKKIIRQDQQSALDSITVPALVVWGDKDRMTLLKYGTMIHKRLKQAEFVVISGATHGLHHEKRRELLDAVVSFCTMI